MDLFKQNNNHEATSMDFYDSYVSKGDNRVRAKDKRMLHKIARRRLKNKIKVVDDNGKF